MPELIEVEQYRQDLDVLVGEQLLAISIHDGRAVRPKGTPAETFTVLNGMVLARTSRHGKLLLADFEDAAGVVVLGVRFGMTGRLLVDGHSSIEQLEYSSSRNDPAWDRFDMQLGSHRVALRDQRCLGSVELDPDLSGLAPEASLLTSEALLEAFAGRRKPVKSALLDQSIIAGLGNLLADEVLWSVGLCPLRTLDSLTGRDIQRLARGIRATVDELSRRGGSNTGDSFVVRQPGALCPRCTGSMRRDVIGGRTAWWCSSHQV